MLEKVKLRPDFQLFADGDAALAAAMYSPDNVGHFGLPTSITRTSRRPSAATRICWCIARSGSAGGRKYTPDRAWDDIGLQCSTTERRADEATRDVEHWLKTFYMKERIGEVFDRTISAVTAFWHLCRAGQRVCRGLVHVSDLGRIITSSTTSSTRCSASVMANVSVSVTVQVKLVQADLESNKIDFVLVRERSAVMARDGGKNRLLHRAAGIGR